MLAAAVLCSSSCGLDPKYATSLTVFHVNEATYDAAPINMNTGDVAGEAFFDIRAVRTNKTTAPLTSKEI